MTLPTVACVVEGHGEVQAAPILIRRIAVELLGVPIVATPGHRVPRGTMLKRPVELVRAVELQSRKAVGGGVLVLLDSDDDDPMMIEQGLGRELSGFGASVRVACAVREYEAWFLAGLPSLIGKYGIASPVTSVDDVESIRDCKGAVGRAMNGKYSEVRHQPAMTAQVDLGVVRENSTSFARLVARVGELLAP